MQEPPSGFTGSDALKAPQTLLAALQSDTGLDSAAIQRAAQISETTGERLELILSRLGLVSDEQIAQLHVSLTGHARADMAKAVVNREMLDILGAGFCRRMALVPLGEGGDAQEVALVDPADAMTVHMIALKLGRPVGPRVATHTEIEAALDRAELETDATDLDEAAAASIADLERLKEVASEAPVIRRVTQIIRTAAEEGASDIHLEPTPQGLNLRYRIDGALRAAECPPAHLSAAIISRLKIMARLDIAENRKPQDGRIKTVVAGRELDMRVATTPTLDGEGVVIRLLDRSGLVLDFTGLGFDERAETDVRKLITAPHGIVLVTGPTGSGKTTTLYAALAAINDAARKIVTVEDPVEYQMAGVTQIQTHASIGLGFAEVLRSVLRQDPDIIMIGEIRDLETAKIAVQAALTGHLVLATLHTNSAAAAINRLRDMGIPDYLLATTLRGAVAQRLVRKLCPVCAEHDPGAYSISELAGRPLASKGFKRAVGCEACGSNGYRGRLALLEVLTLSPALHDLLLRQADETALAEAARAEGMRDLTRHGVERAEQGETSIAEVMRVVSIR